MIASQKLWRTLVRINHLDDSFAYVVVPSWNSQLQFKLKLKYLPPALVAKALKETPVRCHARVNKGAECVEELQFYNWELD